MQARHYQQCSSDDRRVAQLQFRVPTPIPSLHHTNHLSASIRLRNILGPAVYCEIFVLPERVSSCNKLIHRTTVTSATICLCDETAVIPLPLMLAEWSNDLRHAHRRKHSGTLVRVFLPPGGH